VEIERDVGVRPSLEMLQIGKGAGGRSVSCTIAFEPTASTSSYTARQLLVLRGNEVRRLLGDVRVGGQHHRHRLADVAHLVDGEDRLVVERGSVVGLGHQLPDVFAVTTRCTPPTACAASASMRLMRPCATVLRQILP
jgi:hypothetical protein